MSPTLLPFWSRAVVAPSPVDEMQTSAGLIVPVQPEGCDRGVVMALDFDNSSCLPLEVGMVVYYRHATRILDLDVVSLENILAYEPA